LCQTKLTQEEERAGIEFHFNCVLLRCKTLLKRQDISVPSQGTEKFLKHLFFSNEITEEEAVIAEGAFFFLSATDPFFSFNRLRREAEAFG
ncbi:MAG: hypothetical protein U0944_03140, partial [Candidatus Moranbacteria bacterium]|nr:hypothetical protein [Candidatus Moranbacteria bacterium]